MAVDKITKSPTEIELVEKVNEIIDNIGGVEIIPISNQEIDTIVGN